MSDQKTQQKNAQQQPLSSVEVDVLIDELQAEKSPKKIATDPATQAAVRLHALTTDDTIDPQFALQLKQDILQSVQAGSTEIVKKEKRRAIWKMLFLPIAPIGVTAAAIFVAVQLNQPEGSGSEITSTANQSAPLVGAQIRGEEVEKPVGGYTIDYVEFQRRLNERPNTGDLVDLGVGNLPSRGPGSSIDYGENDTSDEDQSAQLYTQLREDAYETLAADVEIAELLKQGGVDVVPVLDHIEVFKQTIDQWPAATDPFNDEAYTAAVNELVQHNKGWNRLMNEITDELIRDYQEQNPQWLPGQPITE
jgi:hypothetical protein